MNDLFLVVYDYPWCMDGTDVWLTKPYKIASSLKDAKKDARFYKRVYPNYDVKVLPVDSTGRFGSPVFKLWINNLSMYRSIVFKSYEIYTFMQRKTLE